MALLPGVAAVRGFTSNPCRRKHCQVLFHSLDCPIYPTIPFNSSWVAAGALIFSLTRSSSFDIRYFTLAQTCNDSPMVSGRCPRSVRKRPTGRTPPRGTPIHPVADSERHLKCSFPRKRFHEGIFRVFHFIVRIARTSSNQYGKAILPLSP